MQENLKSEVAKKFGVTEEAMEKTKGFDQALNIELGKKYKLKFLEDAPREIDLPEEKQKYGKTKTDVITVENVEDGTNYSLYCTPLTLRTRLAQIALLHDGSLKNVVVMLGKTEAELKKWGTKNVYWAKEVSKEVEEYKCSECGVIMQKQEIAVTEDDNGKKKYYCENCKGSIGIQNN